MILADKIIHLRKKCGWSQEELAEKMNVSRQSISKWEGAQSVPDLDKILKLCQVFGVSTDYLLKDEIEEEEMKEDVYEPLNVKHITAELANEFMDKKKKVAKQTGIGVALCIMSPILLIFLSCYADLGNMNENVAVAIGLGMLLLMVAVAVVIFVFGGSVMEEYEWLQREPFVLDYGVTGIVEDRMKKQKSAFTLAMAAGVGLCILGAAVLVVLSVLEIGTMAVVCGVITLLVLVAFAVYLFISFGNERDSYLQLLQKEDYNPERKKNSAKLELVGGIYWCTVTAAYLAVSFITMKWGMTWIIWPVAGVFYGVIASIVEYTERGKRENS